MKNDMGKGRCATARPPYFVSETKKVSELCAIQSSNAGASWR